MKRCTCKIITETVDTGTGSYDHHVIHYCPEMRKAILKAYRLVGYRPAKTGTPKKG